MADPTKGKQSPTGKEKAEVSKDIPGDESGVAFEDLLAGSQVSFVVPDMPVPPKAILSLKDKRVRQRAEDAWKSVFLLQEVIKLWRQFLMYCHLGCRLCPEVENRIIQVFPALKDFGAVIEAFAVDMKLSDCVEVERQRADKAFEICRTPTRQLDDAAKQRYRGIGLNELIQAFRDSITTHAQCLNAVGIKSPIFEQPSDALTAELGEITRVDLNLGGDDPPLDFGGKLRDLASQTTAGKVHQELGRLRNVLEESPVVALGEPQSEPPRRGQWAHQGPPPLNETWSEPIEDSEEMLAHYCGISVKTFKKNSQGKLASVWVMFVHGKRFRVYFRSQRDYAKAKKAWDEAHSTGAEPQIDS